MRTIEIHQQPSGVTLEHMWDYSKYPGPGLYEVDGQLVAVNGCVWGIGHINAYRVDNVAEPMSAELIASPNAVTAADLLHAVAIAQMPELAGELLK